MAPKPKYDPVTGKWVVRNWDGTVAGVKNGDQRRFENLADVETGDPRYFENIVMRELSGLTEESPICSRNNLIDDAIEAAAASDNTTMAQQSRPTFAQIDAVAMGSLADLAGLEEEDLILEFGPLNAGNHNHLKVIANLVQQMADEQKSIPILLKSRRPVCHHLEERTLVVHAGSWTCLKIEEIQKYHMQDKIVKCDKLVFSVRIAQGEQNRCFLGRSVRHCTSARTLIMIISMEIDTNSRNRF